MSAAVAEMRRPAEDRVLLGVCAGLAARLQLDVTLVRIVAAVGLVVLTAPFLVAYAAFALVVPRSDGRMLIGGEPADRRESFLGWLLVLLAAGTIIATPGLLGTGDIGLFGIGALIIGLSLVGWAVSRTESRGEAAGPEPGSPADVAEGASSPVEPQGGAGGAGTAQTAVLDPAAGAPRQREAGEPGVAAQPAVPSVLVPTLAALATVVGLAAVTVAVFDLEVTAASVAILTGSMAVICGGVVIACWGRRGAVPLIVIGTFLALFASATAVARSELDRGIGYRELTPADAAAVESGFEIGLGYMQIDLRDTELPPGDTTMPVHVGYGAAGIIVPPGLEVVSEGDSIRGDVDSASGGGAASEPADSTGNGANQQGKRGKRARDTAPEPPVLVIDAEIAGGAVDVSREGQRGLF